MEHGVKTNKIVRLGDGSRRVHLKLAVGAASYLANDAVEVWRPARGYAAHILDRSSRELTVEVVLSPTAYEVLSAKARKAGARKGEFVEASIRRLLDRPRERSHDEALELTREFIEANSDWLHTRS
jgi:hypothetical protein